MGNSFILENYLIMYKNDTFSYCIEVYFFCCSELWFLEQSAYANFSVDFLMFLHYSMYLISCLGNESEKVSRKTGNVPSACKAEKGVGKGKGGVCWAVNKRCIPIPYSINNKIEFLGGSFHQAAQLVQAKLSVVCCLWFSLAELEA